MTENNSKEPNGIVVDVYGVYKSDDKNTYILDSFSFESTESFPVICEISEEDSEIAKKHIDKQIIIQLTAHPLSKPEIYENEEEFEKQTKEDNLFISSESFLASPQGVLVPEAMITGVVKNVTGPYIFQNEDASINYYEVKIEFFGITITAIFKEENYTVIKPGSIITSIYYLWGELLTK